LTLQKYAVYGILDETWFNLLVDEVNALIGGSIGDMLKSVYDTNANNIVDNSEKLEGSTKAQVQDHTPKAHTLASHSTKTHSELSDAPTSAHHVKTVSSEILLASMGEKDHASLTNVLTGQHHVKTISSEILLASMGEKDHASLTNVLTSQHHVKTVASELNLADMAEKSHLSLADVGANDHHTPMFTVSGIATILANTEFIEVTHGKGSTPTLPVPVPLDNLKGMSFWIPAAYINDTTFRIYISSIDMDNHQFKWVA